MTDFFLLVLLVAVACAFLWSVLPREARGQVSNLFWRVWIRTAEWMLSIAGAGR